MAAVPQPLPRLLLPLERPAYPRPGEGSTSARKPPSTAPTPRPAPLNSSLPNLELREGFDWPTLHRQPANQQLVAEVGFPRGGRRLKLLPQTCCQTGKTDSRSCLVACSSVGIEGRGLLPSAHIRERGSQTPACPHSRSRPGAPPWLGTSESRQPTPNRLG